MHRIFKRSDGSIAILVFATDDPKLIERDTNVVLADNPGAVVVGDNLPVPTTRRFRNVWMHDGVKVTPHMDKARAQVLAEVRVKRDAALAATDGEYLRAQERGAVPQELTDKRQALRDLPAVVAADLAKLSTPEELENYVAPGL